MSALGKTIRSRRSGVFAWCILAAALLLAAGGPLRLVSASVAADAAPAPSQTEPAPPVTEPETILETAVTDAVSAVESPAGDGKQQGKPAETPEEAAARAEAELREKREQERKTLLEEAEQFVESADIKIITTLPYPFNLLFGIRIFGITLWRYLAALGLILLAFFLLFLFTRRMRRANAVLDKSAELTRWQRAMDVAFLAMRNPVKLIIVGLMIRSVSSLMVTKYHPELVWTSSFLIYIGIVFYFFILVGIIDQVYGDRLSHGDRLMETVRPILLKIIRFFILFIAGMQIYQAITGEPMISLLAGLGIGGLALALASQETLQNLLGFASIALDKSFLVGDAVNIAGYDGTVEHVGLRSTRVRTYDGNLIVIPNSSAINSNIVNRNRRPFIRREIRIALSPLNPHSKVVEAMDAINEVLMDHEGRVNGLPPVVRFVDYEPARFIIQGLFWYDSDKPFYLDECSRVNLEICRRLTELGVIYAER